VIRLLVFDAGARSQLQSYARRPTYYSISSLPLTGPGTAVFRAVYCNNPQPKDNTLAFYVCDEAVKSLRDMPGRRGETDQVHPRLGHASHGKREPCHIHAANVRFLQ
jgi:hypothetical protein